MYPRRLILKDKDLAHVFFRCHNRNYFFRPIEVKNLLIWLLAKNKARYNIQIFEFIIMDNHAHLIIKASSAENLGNFMRTVNSQLARFINKYFDRDSQAIRERYKSPMITSTSYLKRAMQYIWTNRYKIDNRVRPEKDPFCSAYWRLNKPHKYNSNPSNKWEEKENLLSKLLDSYAEIDINCGDSEAYIVRKWLNEATNEMKKLVQEFFENSHTIGDQETVTYRGELLSAFVRTHDPPNVPQC